MHDTVNYRSKFFVRLLGLRRSEEFCDTVIRVRELSFPCHKIVLAASSPVLQAIIKEKFVDGENFAHLTLQMDFLTPSELELLLDYLYTGEVLKLTESENKQPNISLIADIFTDAENEGLSLFDVANKLSNHRPQSNGLSNPQYFLPISDSDVVKIQDGVRGEPHQENSTVTRKLMQFNTLNLSAQSLCDTTSVTDNNNVDYDDPDEKDAPSIGSIRSNKSVKQPKKLVVMEFPSMKDRWKVLPNAAESENEMEDQYCDDEFYETTDYIEEDSVLKKSDLKGYGDARSFINHANSPTNRLPRIKLPRKPPFLCPCQNCGKIFESHQRLRSHYRHTHGEKKYKCDLCPLRFLYPKDLKSHMRTHTGEKPYVCEICGKGCSQMGSLTIHRKTHEKEKNQANVIFRPCPACAKRYCLKDRERNLDYLNELDSHLALCICPNSNCAKKFSSSKCLRKHLRNDVCNPNKYYCGKCGEIFDKNTQLRYHVGTVHCTHKKRKRVKTESKEISTLHHNTDEPVKLLSNITQVEPLSSHLETGIETLSPIPSSNIEEITGLLQLSEEVVIKDGEY